jgi:hypothetical protein
MDKNVNFNHLPEDWTPLDVVEGATALSLLLGVSLAKFF